MKRGIIIISIFAVLLGLCIVEEVLLKQNLSLLLEKSNNLVTIVENSENVNTENIESEINSLKEFWDKAESYFCIVVNHINMEEAGEQISKIVTLSKQNKKDELLVELNLLVYYAKSYEHIIVPNFQNIL